MTRPTPLRNEWREGLTLPEYAERWVDMVPHVETLTRLASEATATQEWTGGYRPRIVEFGVRGGVSTWALLDGLHPEGLLYGVDRMDVLPILPPRVRDDPRFRFIRGSSITVPLPLSADLVLIDTSHTVYLTSLELHRAAGLGAHRIVLHDYATKGVRRAVDKWLAPPWHLEFWEPSEWGLAVLAR